jgi:hypothetical protein
MQPDLPTNTPALGRWIGKSQAFGLIAAKCRPAARPLAGSLFGETKPISALSASRAPARTHPPKRTQIRLRRQLLVSLKSATCSHLLALGQIRRTNPIPPIPPLATRRLLILAEQTQFQPLPPSRAPRTPVLPNEPNPISGHLALPRMAAQPVFPNEPSFAGNP